MEEERYLALLGYIKRQEYLAGLTKSQKYILRRASKNYQVVGDQLHYTLTLMWMDVLLKDLYFMEKKK